MIKFLICMHTTYALHALFFCLSIKKVFSLDVDNLSNLQLQISDEALLIDNLASYQHVRLADDGIEECMRYTKSFKQQIIKDFCISTCQDNVQLNFRLKIPKNITAEMFNNKYSKYKIMKDYKPSSKYEKQFYEMFLDNYKLLLDHTNFSINYIHNYFLKLENDDSTYYQLNIKQTENLQKKILYFEYKMITAINYMIRLQDVSYRDTFIYHFFVKKDTYEDYYVLTFRYENCDYKIIKANFVADFHDFFVNYVQNKVEPVITDDIEDMYGKTKKDYCKKQKSSTNNVVGFLKKVQSSRSRFYSLTIHNFDYEQKIAIFYGIKDQEHKILERAGFENEKNNQSAYSFFVNTFNIDTISSSEQKYYKNYLQYVDYLFCNLSTNFDLYNIIQNISEQYYKIVSYSLKYKKLEEQILYVETDENTKKTYEQHLYNLKQTYLQNIKLRTTYINTIASKKHKYDIFNVDLDEKIIFDDLSVDKIHCDLENYMIRAGYCFRRCPIQILHTNKCVKLKKLHETLLHYRKRHKMYKQIFVNNYTNKQLENIKSKYAYEEYIKLVTDLDNHNLNNSHEKVKHMQNHISYHLSAILKYNFYLYNDFKGLLATLKEISMFLN